MPDSIPRHKMEPIGYMQGQTRAGVLRSIEHTEQGTDKTDESAIRKGQSRKIIGRESRTYPPKTGMAEAIT